MNSSKIESAREIAKNGNETILFLDECKIIKNAAYKKKRLIILTEKHIFYFSRFMALKKKLNLIKISNITIDNKQISLDFTLDFGLSDSIKISLPKNWESIKHNLIDKILFAIQHLLTNIEIQRITNNNFTLKSRPSYYGIFCRLESSIENPLIKLDPFDDIRIRFLIFFHKKLVDFSTFTNPEASSKFLLESISLCPSFKYISIKEFENQKIYQYLDNYTDYLTTVENISIDGDATDLNSFTDFLKRMRENLNSRMTGLSFSNSKFIKDHLNILQQYVFARKLQSLEFQNSFLDKTVFQFFISNFLPTLSQIPDFISLSLEDIEYLDFEELYKSLPPQLKSLSAVNCNVSIDQALNTLNSDSKSEKKDLSVLNLSYNTFNAKHKMMIKEMSFAIPSFLTVIILDHITFPYGVMIPFLNSLFRTVNNDTDISLAQMISSEDDFGKLDEMFERLVRDFQLKRSKMKYIRSLKWDSNPISTNFISFLELQTSLLSLSISGCYSPDDQDGFDDFCEYLSNNRSLTKLICRRFNQISLESLTVKLIEAVGRSKINFLDISNSRGGSKCYEALKSLMSFPNEDDQNEHNNLNSQNQSSLSQSGLKIPHLRCLIYDGLRPFKKEQLIDFVQFIDNDEFSCRCSFPIHDIEYLFKGEKINYDDIYKIISHSQIKTPDDYIKPFTTFYKENQAKFPFYFKEECSDIYVAKPIENNSEAGEDEESDVLQLKNKFEIEGKAEIKPSLFFGNRISQIGIESIPRGDDFFFSCRSDDEDENAGENKDKNRNAQTARKLSILAMSKYPNSKSAKPDYLQSKIDDDFTLIIDDDELELELNSQQIDASNKTNSNKKQTDSFNNSKRRQTDQLNYSNKKQTNQVNNSKRRQTDQLNYSNKKQTNQVNNSKNNRKQISNTYSDYEDEVFVDFSSPKPKNKAATKKPSSSQLSQKNQNDDYYYDYYSQEEKTPKIQKTKSNTKSSPKKNPIQTKNAAIPNRNRPVLPLRGKPLNPILMRKPVNMRIAASKSANTINKKPANTLKWNNSSEYSYYSNYGDEDEYYSSEGKKNQTPKSKNQTNSLKNTNRIQSNSLKNQNQKAKNQANTQSRNQTNNQNRNQVNNQNRNQLGTQKNANRIQSNSKKINQTNKRSNNNIDDVVNEDLPFLLSINTDPSYNNVDVVTMSPDKKYSELKVLQTDSESSYENDYSYE